MNPIGSTKDEAGEPDKAIEASPKKAVVTDRRKGITVTNIEANRYEILWNVASRFMRELNTTAANPRNTPSKAMRL